MQKIERHEKPIMIVIGGQYGSESKGLVTGHLANRYRADFAVRTGSINAGHTVYFRGKKYVNQQIPVAWVNSNTNLIIGAGAYVDPEILSAEIEMINQAMPESEVKDRLFIDKRCGVHLPNNYKSEQDLRLHEKMGSTGHGVMSAIISKMQRSEEYMLFGDTDFAQGYNIVDTVEMLNDAYDECKQILIEGTQGALLDFHLGFYPFVTTRQTNAANWLAECGLSPMLATEVHIVIRTLPIRVAGNSGYMGEEIRWQDLAFRINNKLNFYGKDPIVDNEIVKKFAIIEGQLITNAGFTTHPVDWSVPERWERGEFLSKLHVDVLSRMTPDEVAELKKFFEITTVTKKLRRIAEFSDADFAYTLRLNRPRHVHINFLNYIFPTCWGIKSQEELKKCSEWPEILEWLNSFAARHSVYVQTVNCAPDSIFEIDGIGITNA